MRPFFSLGIHYVNSDKTHWQGWGEGGRYVQRKRETNKDRMEGEKERGGERKRRRGEKEEREKGENDKEERATEGEEKGRGKENE